MSCMLRNSPLETCANGRRPGMRSHACSGIMEIPLVTIRHGLHRPQSKCLSLHGSGNRLAFGVSFQTPAVESCKMCWSLMHGHRIRSHGVMVRLSPQHENGLAWVCNRLNSTCAVDRAIPSNASEPASFVPRALSCMFGALAVLSQTKGSKKLLLGLAAISSSNEDRWLIEGRYGWIQAVSVSAWAGCRDTDISSR